jgi:hypothetical protein
MTCTTVERPERPVRPARRSRRRAPVLVAAMAALAVLASACHQDNTPQFYNSVTKDNFTQGCIGASTGSPGTTLASPSLCDCMYTVTTGSIPASSADEKKRSKEFAGYNGQTFNQINSALKTNPQKIPTSLQQAWADSCSNDGYKGTTTTTAKPASGGPTTTS